MLGFAVKFSVTESGRKRPEYTLDTDLHGEVTLAEILQFTKTTLILTADQILKEEQANGFDQEPIIAVDGRINKSVKDVSPLGKIEFTSRVDALTILSDTYEAIMEKSKVGDGTPGYNGSHYKENNRVFYNGTQIASTTAELAAWIATQPELKNNDLIRFVNIQPYARRLERLGVTAGRTQSRTVEAGAKRKRPLGFLTSIPNGVYALTARSIKAKYKRNSNIAFAYVSGSDIGLSDSVFKKGVKSTHGNGKLLSAGRAYLYPSIVITISDRGTL